MPDVLVMPPNGEPRPDPDNVVLPVRNVPCHLSHGDPDRDTTGLAAPQYVAAGFRETAEG